MRGQALALASTVSGALACAQVLGDILGSNPWAGIHGIVARVVQIEVEKIVKSLSNGITAERIEMPVIAGRTW